MKTCPTCGTRSDTHFCPSCGMDLSTVPETKICPTCGAETTTNYCPDCGCNLLESLGIDSEISSTSTSEQNQSNSRDSELISHDLQESAIEDAKVQASSSSVKKPTKSKKKIFAIIGAILLLLIIIGAIAGGNDEDTSSTPSTETDSYYEEESTEPTTEATTEPTTSAPKEEFTKEEDYEEISYDKLARNPDDYEGDLVKNSGNVIQVMDGENEVDLRIATSSDGYDDVVLAYYDPSIVDSRILEDDHVTYYGRSKGLYTYESTMGGEITVPLVQIHKITRD